MVEPNKTLKGESLMSHNLQKVLSTYCESEIRDLKGSEIFTELQNLANELNYSIVCEYGKECNNRKAENVYLSVTIFNDKNEMIEIFDEGFITAYTPLVLVDKKHRYRFFSWNDAEFVEDLNWIIKELKNQKNNSLFS